ncbi:MAG: hypothetical protein EOM72_05720 [Opitutae bacterium]|nr:hypothetical protein [Opitutae bacterium]
MASTNHRNFRDFQTPRRGGGSPQQLAVFRTGAETPPSRSSLLHLQKNDSRTGNALAPRRGVAARVFPRCEASCRTLAQTVGTEPDPPENKRYRVFLAVEGRPPHRPGSFCKRLCGTIFSIAWNARAPRTDCRRQVPFRDEGQTWPEAQSRKDFPLRGKPHTMGLQKMKFTAIDFETANARRGSACAVGLVMVENGQIVGRLSQLIRPEPLAFDPFNVSIHGITAKEVADAPTFSECWPSLWPRITGPLVAHNAAFDMSVLRSSLDSFRAQYPETEYFCTCVISKLAWPEFPTFALNHVAREIGVSFTHHDAEEDAFACAHVAMAACKKLGASSLYDLPGSCGLRVGRLFAGGYCPCGCPRPARSRV